MMGLRKGASFTASSPEFRVSPHQLRRRGCLPFRKKRFIVRSYFGRETFPASINRLRGLEMHCDHNSGVSGGHCIQHPAVSKKDVSIKLPQLSFSRLQLKDEECSGLLKRNFGRFVAREAILDEEYWTAAWLRAEAHWESASHTRHVDNYKRTYAEQEFYALRRRCLGQDGNYLKCFCFVTVKREEKNVRRTVLSSVVGTLDLSIRQYLHGETYPGEARRISAVFVRQKPFDEHKYAYIANVCVSKFMRCQGVASNMIYLATDVANLAGMKQLFIHVCADNIAARKLYQKTGFKIVEAASQTMSKDQTLLMLLEL